MDIAVARRLHAIRVTAVRPMEAVVRPLLLHEAVIQAEAQEVLVRLSVAVVHARPAVAEVFPFRQEAVAEAEAVVVVAAVAEAVAVEADVDASFLRSVG